MSDLLKRLRDESWRYMKFAPTPVDLAVWHDTYCEAADEIERLLIWSSDSHVTELEAETKRLRVAAGAVVKARDFLDDEMRNRGKSSRGPVWDAIDDLHAVAGIEAPSGDENRG